MYRNTFTVIIYFGYLGYIKYFMIFPIIITCLLLLSVYLKKNIQFCSGYNNNDISLTG